MHSFILLDFVVYHLKRFVCFFLSVHSMFLNNVHLSGELWEINYVDTVCLYYRMLVVTSFCLRLWCSTSVELGCFKRIYFIYASAFSESFLRNKEYMMEEWNQEVRWKMLFFSVAVCRSSKLIYFKKRRQRK